jgi:hypothetical protein
VSYHLKVVNSGAVAVVRLLEALIVVVVIIIVTSRRIITQTFIVRTGAAAVYVGPSQQALHIPECVAYVRKTEPDILTSWLIFLLVG